MLQLKGKDFSTLAGVDFGCAEGVSKVDVSNNLLQNLQGIEVCKNLTWLNASHNLINSIKHVKKLKSLAVLNLGHNKIKSTAYVEKLLGLKALILNNNELEVLSGLEKLKELNSLIVSHNRLKELDVSMLPALMKLSASHNQLTNVPKLESNEAVGELRLNDNKIKDIPDWLAKCKKLKLVDLGNNAIDSIAKLDVLRSLPGLENLNLLGNPVCDAEDFFIQIKSMFPNLRVCNGRKLADAYFKALESRDKSLSANPKVASGRNDVKLAEKVSNENSSTPDAGVHKFDTRGFVSRVASSQSKKLDSEATLKTKREKKDSLKRRRENDGVDAPSNVDPLTAPNDKDSKSPTDDNTSPRKRTKTAGNKNEPEIKAVGKVARKKSSSGKKTFKTGVVKVTAVKGQSKKDSSTEHFLHGERKFGAGGNSLW